MIAIIVAMDSEMTYLKGLVEDICLNTINNTSIFTGKIRGVDITLVKCGIGKAMSAFTTATVIDHFRPKAIINVGVAGGLKEETSVLDVIIGNRLFYHDVDITSFGDLKYGQMANFDPFFETDRFLRKLAVEAAGLLGLKAYVADIISGDSFITEKDRMDIILQTHFSDYDIAAVDMESASIAQVSTFLETPFLVIRALSDKVGEQSQSLKFEEFVDQAAKIAGVLVESLIVLWKKQLEK